MRSAKRRSRYSTSILSYHVVACIASCTKCAVAIARRQIKKASRREQHLIGQLIALVSFSFFSLFSSDRDHRATVTARFAHDTAHEAARVMVDA